MKFGEDVLLEIVEILREGISEGKDISDLLRDVDLSIETGTISDQIVLSLSYKERKGRVV